MGILTQHMYKAPVQSAPSYPRPRCRRRSKPVILKCLSKKPEGRYNSMDELSPTSRRSSKVFPPDALAGRSWRAPARSRNPGGLLPDVRDAGPRPRVAPPRRSARVGTPLIVAIGVVAAGHPRCRDRFVPAHGDERGPADPGRAPSTPVTAAPAPTPVTTSAPTPALPATGAALTPVTVTLAVTPASAKVMRVGTTVNLNAARGLVGGEGDGRADGRPCGPLMIEVSAPGYKTAVVEADGRAPLLRLWTSGSEHRS